MMRLVRLVTCLVIVGLAGVSRSQAQTTTEPRWYGEFTVAATLGHKSDKAFGGEVGGRLTGDVDVFVEGGHMGNVGNTDLEARAQKIANFLGGNVGSSGYKLNFFAIGLKYGVPMAGRYHPYVALGVGLATIKPEVTFGVGGTDVTGDLANRGVQLGADLSDSQNQLFILVGGGLMVNFATRYFADASYRYGRTSAAKEGDETLIKGLNTQRVQIGVGVRF
jgi:opacity protein-like surface antigen